MAWKIQQSKTDKKSSRTLKDDAVTRELIDRLRQEFQDKETRDIYCDEFLNAYIATQIKVLREKQGLTQAALAELAGMRPERISVLEDVNYSSWTLNVLRRLAKAFDLRLSVKFETFGSFLPDFESFCRDALDRVSFNADPAFHQPPNNVAHDFLNRLAVKQEHANVTVVAEALQRSKQTALRPVQTKRALL